MAGYHYKKGKHYAKRRFDRRWIWLTVITVIVLVVLLAPNADGKTMTGFHWWTIQKQLNDHETRISALEIGCSDTGTDSTTTTTGSPSTTTTTSASTTTSTTKPPPSTTTSTVVPPSTTTTTSPPTAFDLEDAIWKTPVGGTVQIPAGVWRIADTVALKSGVSLQGVPGQTVLYMAEKPSPTSLLWGRDIHDIYIRDIIIRGDGPWSMVYGIHVYGGYNLNMFDCTFEDCTYAIKLGGGPHTEGWRMDRVTVRNSLMSMYIDNVSNSTFTDLDLDGVRMPGMDQFLGMNWWLWHTLYIEGDCDNLTFSRCSFTGGNGWSIQFWGGASGNIDFYDTHIGVGGYGSVVTDQDFHDVHFYNTDIDASMPTHEGDIFRLYGGIRFLFDGFTVEGGDTMVLVGRPTTDFVFRNGTVGAASLGGGDGVSFENVYLTK